MGWINPQIITNLKQGWHDWWHGHAYTPPPPPEPEPEAVVQAAPEPLPNQLPEWKGDNTDLLSLLWGDGNVAPTEDAFFNTMYSQLGLNNSMTVLDVGDGMAGAGVALALNHKCFVDCFITNPQFAAQATRLLQKQKVATRVTLHPYDLEPIKLTKRYEAVSLRRVLWRVPDAKEFIDTISGQLKERARLVMSDYLAETPVLSLDGMSRWFQQEGFKNSMSLGHLLNILEKNAFEVRVAEDISAQHEAEIRQGLQRLRDFVRDYRIDDTRKEMIMAEADRWVMRAHLLHEGLQLYRFFAQRRR